MDIERLEKNLEFLLDQWGGFVDQQELLKMEKQKTINSILTPEQIADIESIEFEFEEKEKVIREREKTARKQLDLVLRQYAEQVQLQKNEKRVVKGKFAKVSVSDGDVEYDAKAIDAYAIAGHPEILAFRNEGKKKTRVEILKDIKYTKE